MGWLSSEGGPLVIVARVDADKWGGIENGDYNRACSVEDYVGVVDIGNSQALVLGDEPSATKVFESIKAGVLIARWIYGENEEKIDDWINKLSPETFQTPSEVTRFQAIENRFLIFDSVLRGNQSIGLEFTLAPNTYEIKTVHFEPNKETSLLLHKFFVV